MFSLNLISNFLFDVYILYEGTDSRNKMWVFG